MHACIMHVKNCTFAVIPPFSFTLHYFLIDKKILLFLSFNCIITTGYAHNYTYFHHLTFQIIHYISPILISLEQ